MSKPTIGRILLYVIAKGDLPDDLRLGEIRPAMIVKNGGDTFNAHVFLDGFNDIHGVEGMRTLWKTGLQVSEQPEPGKLHWPPRT